MQDDPISILVRRFDAFIRNEEMAAIIAVKRDDMVEFQGSHMDPLDRITALEARLELTGDFKDGPDGIECRDETIALLDAKVERLEAKLAAARRDALEEAARVAHGFKDRIKEPSDWFIAVDISQAIRALMENSNARPE